MSPIAMGTMTNTITTTLTTKTPTASTLMHTKRAISMLRTIPPHSMKAASIIGKTKRTTRLCYILMRRIHLDQTPTNTTTSHILCLRLAQLRILRRLDGGRPLRKYNYSTETWCSIAQFHPGRHLT